MPVGNESASIFYRIAKYFWRYRSAVSRPACFRRCVTKDALAADECPSQSRKSEIAAAEGNEPPTPSGGIAKPRVELFHCGRGKLLVRGRKVLTIATYLSATHLKRFRITHIARMQNV